MGKSKSVLSNFFAYPGLLLQRITTNEPDGEQIEVAIRALKVAEGIPVEEGKIEEIEEDKEMNEEKIEVELKDDEL